MGKHTSPRPTMQDVLMVMEAFQQELGLHVKITLQPRPGEGNGIVEAIVYRSINGVSLGICKGTEPIRPGDDTAGRAVALLHKLYWQASDLAHSGMRPSHAPRK